YDIIGVTKPIDGVTEEIKLIFSKEQADYIHTKPIHASQKARFIDTGELLVTIKVIPNYELEMLLLAFGEKVKVIAPDVLVCKMKDRLSRALGNY
ncbi:MAG: WYL domain-containing protein, partial [Bacteroidales bacterium]|nr:WYL domain-containing protein [Bacteroidales bacterium]